MVGLKESVTGDTLCDAAHPLLLEKIEFPETVISMSIEPVELGRQGQALGHPGGAGREDPTFAYKVNEETGQTLISGMGELHLEIIKNRMIRDYNLKVHVGRPRVSYRETIKKAVKKVQGTCIRQTGGSGMYAKVTIDLEPEAQPKGAPVLRFVNALKGGVIPGEFLSSVEAGFREAAKSGGRTGFPLVDLKVTLVDGDTHDVDSNELAFRFAAGDALDKAVQEAGAVLLEPIMKLEVVTPEDYLGNVMADLRAAAPRSTRPSTAASSGSSRPAPAGEDVRLLHRRPEPQPGPRQLLDGAAGIRRRPREHAGEPGRRLSPGTRRRTGGSNVGGSGAIFGPLYCRSLARDPA